MRQMWIQLFCCWRLFSTGQDGIILKWKWKMNSKFSTWPSVLISNVRAHNYCSILFGLLMLSSLLENKVWCQLTTTILHFIQLLNYESPSNQFKLYQIYKINKIAQRYHRKNKRNKRLVAYFSMLHDIGHTWPTSDYTTYCQLWPL